MAERLMKDSGINWIGEIPKMWKVTRFKYTHNISNTGESIDKEHYSEIEGDTIFYMAGATPVKTTFSDFPEWKYTSTSDLLLSRNGTPYVYLPVMRAAYSDHVIRTSIKNNYVKEYVRYALQQSINNEIVETVSIPTWSISLWNEQKLPMPDEDEQARIADFLDKKVSEIDVVITKTKESIEEYKKLKQSIITEAVTKGLESNAEMRDSGIEWIGLHSSKAEIVRLKFFSYMKGRVGWQGLKFEDFIEEGPYCITGTDFENGKVNWGKCYHVSQERYEMDPYIQVKNGDLLITKDGTIGKLAIINDMPGPACLNSHLLIIRPLREKFTNKYLYYVMKSDVFLKYYKLIGSGKTTMDSLSQENTGNFSFPAYDLQTQNRIVEFLDYQNSKYDEIIFKKEQVITELEQYKKSLIYEYVTGKKEVLQ